MLKFFDSIQNAISYFSHELVSSLEDDEASMRNNGDEQLDEMIRRIHDLRKVQPLVENAQALREALDYLLQQTVDQDLKYGIVLSEEEDAARKQAQAVMAITVVE